MVIRPAVFSFGVIRCAPSPSVFSYSRRFSPSASLRYSPSGGDDLSSHLRKLVITDGLCGEDAASIKRALSRNKIGEMLSGYGSNDEDQARRFALDSIDEYIDMALNEVDNAGALVKLIMSIKLNKALAPNEFRKECLVALASVDEATAGYAVRVYLSQKKRRETNGLSKIADPSSYVMAILRNASTHAPGSVPVRRPPDEMTPKLVQQDTYNVEVKDRADDVPERVPSITTEEADACLDLLKRLEEPVNKLDGVGPKTKEQMSKLGIQSIRDLLFHFPRAFVDRSEVQEDVLAIQDGDVATIRVRLPPISKRKFNSVDCTDVSGNGVRITFFYGNTPRGRAISVAAMKSFEDEDEAIVFGKVNQGKVVNLMNPTVVPADKVAQLGIEPIYSLTAGLSQKKLHSAIDEAIQIAQNLVGLLPESLPDSTLELLGWPTFGDALMIAHRPRTMRDADIRSPARLRLAFEEMTIQQSMLAMMRWKLKVEGFSADSTVAPKFEDSALVTAAIDTLPFRLTTAQIDGIKDIYRDCTGNTRMYRLLQGDVGSGKTVVAYLAGLACVEACGGGVFAFLAPTQLLAAQHSRTLTAYADAVNKVSDWRIRVHTLTGDVVGRARDGVLSQLEDLVGREAVILVGTHALASNDVVKRLRNLSSPNGNGSKGLCLAVIDEEQRFGVRLRDELVGSSRHTLFLSATPIPRSIALKGYGILDCTLLESSKARSCVETTITSATNIDKAIAALQRKIENSKAFWILPRIVRSSEDDCDRGSVQHRYKILVDRFGKEKVARVHGRMKSSERQAQLESFASSESDVRVLVATTVIEVGIDVPDADVLVVEDANDFSLAQLHQLRGRIGRAATMNNDTRRPRPQCLLISRAAEDDIGAQSSSRSMSRLQFLQQTSDGADVADFDFMMRGPGEVQGTKQSGVFSGRAIDADSHYGLIDASKRYGRALADFELEGNGPAFSECSDDSKLLLDVLSHGKARPYYDCCKISTLPGFALRSMMMLFADKKIGTVIESLEILQRLDGVRSLLAPQDDALHAKVVAFAKEVCQHTAHLTKPPQSELSDKKLLLSTNTSSAKERGEHTAQVTEPQQTELVSLPSKPHVAAASQLPRQNSIDLRNSDVTYLIVDVETTGLDDKSSYVIQLAAKVYGEDDTFCAYAAPPKHHNVPKELEKLTGITNDFLRNGGYDTLGTRRDPAKPFADVYNDFVLFCEARVGAGLVFVAHNAKFDIRMLNGELRRVRQRAHGSGPSLSDTFVTSVDTLSLFRRKEWWQTLGGVRREAPPRPSSFSLGSVYETILKEEMQNSHNAVGDVQAVEKLLSHEHFKGWESVANEIQNPFIRMGN